MQYRRFGANGTMVSALGFGCMRFPTTNGKPDGKVDRPEAVRMLRHAIDAGVNYLDTAKVYHGGTSEKVVGTALKNGYRSKVMVATKLPLWNVRSLRDADRILDEQLTDLGTECVDYYLFHNLQAHSWQNCRKLKLPEWALRKKKQGKIAHLGFSFHDSHAVFLDILNGFDSWEFCQIQYNYVNETVQAGTRGLHDAASKGLHVIVMEPLLGGVLANPPGEMGRLCKKNKWNPVDLAFRWLWDKPEVSLALSGMSSMKQVEANLEIADRGKQGGLGEKEKKAIDELQAAYKKALPIRCTKCGYCLPCPAGVDIPTAFEMYNNMTALPENAFLNKTLYSSLPPDRQASACTRCGACESKCPQHLQIRTLLDKAHAVLAEV
ncbi:MAG TPA: aldo/keto reductase [Planctomycetaceae bacterium]|nr:aldo/keto reductase [Planctomycetaceae bacterium]